MNTRIKTLGAAAFALIAVTVSSATVYSSYQSSDPVLVPPMLGGNPLAGQAIPIQINEFTAEQAAAGIILPKDSHNFFSCETAKIKPRHNNLGNTRTWVYEFRGDEPPFKGDFFVSDGELAANPQYRGLDTLRYIYSGRRYYQMGEIDLRFSCSGGLSLVDFCGDNSCQADENAQSCPQDCNICGDGVMFGNEQCDDKNGLDGDGCDVFCKTELGYACEGEPSTCKLLIPSLPGSGGGSSSSSANTTSSSSTSSTACTDTDGGYNIYEKGTATLGNQEASDSCVNQGTLTEYSCDFGFMEATNVNCENGCNNGACQQSGNTDASSLKISIDGPATSAHSAKEKDVNFGNVRFETENKPALIKSIYIAVQALKPENSIASSIDVNEALEEIRLQNAQGVRNRAVRLTSSVDSGPSFGGEPGSFQIYRFDDVTLVGNETWKFMADFNGEPENGDAFRIHVCGEPTHKQLQSDPNILVINTSGCNFGGLIYESTAYQIHVVKPFAQDFLGDVRPGGNLAGNFQKIDGTQASEPEGHVVMKNIGTSDTATEQEKDINLLRFEVSAKGADLLFALARFEAQQGSLNNATNYALWVDTDGNGNVDTILEDGANSMAGQVTFNDLAGGGYAIAKDNGVIFEVHADVASALVNNTLQLAFVGGTSTPFEMETLASGQPLFKIERDGDCEFSSGCNVIFSTVDSIVWNFAEQGSLFVTKDSTPIRNRQLLNGSLSDAIMRLEFHAENEAADVNYLHFAPVGTMPASIDRLGLYLDGQTSKFAEATKGACNQGDTGFCADMRSQQLIVPAGEDVNVIVRAYMKSDAQGGKTNEPIQLTISGNGAVEAIGDSSSNELDVYIGTETPGANTPIISEKHVSVSAKISSIANANPDANGTAVPTGTSNIGQFKFTAAAHNNSKNGDNDVAIDGLVFDVKATNIVIDASSFAFYRKENSLVTKTCAPHYLSGEQFTSRNVSGSFRVVCKDIDLSAVDGEIDEGESETFVLQAEIINPKLNSVTTSTLQVSLTDFTNINGTFGVTGSHILWLDVDQLDGAEFHWVEYPENTVSSTSYSS